MHHPFFHAADLTRSTEARSDSQTSLAMPRLTRADVQQFPPRAAGPRATRKSGFSLFAFFRRSRCESAEM